MESMFWRRIEDTTAVIFAVTGHGAHDVRGAPAPACPNRSYLKAHGFELDRYIEHPLILEQGMAISPMRPGHGISFDWNALGRFSA